MSKKKEEAHDKVTEETTVDEIQLDEKIEADAESLEITEVDQLKQKVEELEDKLLRSAAEFENYKKQSARRSSDMIEYASDRILIELLEVIDNFERAMAHAGEDTDNDSISKGMEMILGQMKNLLEKEGIKPIESVGLTFDPKFHEAMMQVESDEHEEGMITLEINRGYKKGDRVLRHSRVAVSKGNVESEEGEKQAD